MVFSLLSIVIFTYLVDSTNSYNIDVENVMKFADPRNVFFGYVTELTKNSDGYWLLVTAPKDQQKWNPNVTAPGALYKCPIHINTHSSQSCVQVPADFSSGQGPINHIHPESNQFLGASLDIKSDQSQTVICAPLFKYFFERDTSPYPLGRCFTLNADFTLRDVNGFLLFTPDRSEDKNFFAEAGFSVTYTKGGNFDLVFATPGMTRSAGGFFGRFAASQNYWLWNKLPESHWEYSYLGYSVDSGIPYGAESDITFAFGAPAFNRRGSVLLLHHNIIRYKEEGHQIGEGFGMAVCLEDVNGDGMDDLLIGAPLFTSDSGKSENPGDFIDDQGVVRLYMGVELGRNRYKGLINEKITLTGSRKVGARFGHAIAGLGDINKDGYNDVVVGAPYEDSSVGAIYIYNGGSDGLRDVFSQRIGGQDVSSGIKGFGWHISSPMDVDKNSYNDFAVSSYWSEEVLLFRTRPSVDLIGTLTLTPPAVPLNISVNNCSQFLGPCLYVNLCFYYGGRFMPESLLISYKLEADTVQTGKGLLSRVQLRLHGAKYNKLHRNISISINTTQCELIVGVITSLAPENIFEVMKFDAEFHLTDIPQPPGQITPILNEALPKVLSKNATFRINCSENICKSDLSLKHDYQLSHNDPRFIVIGKSIWLDLLIDLSNQGEPSYATIVTVSVSSGVKYVRTNTQSESKAVSCNIIKPEKNTDTSFQNLTCTAGNPLLRSEKGREFKMRFDVSKSKMIPNNDLNQIPEKVVVSMDAITESKDINEEDNHIKFNVSVHLQANVQITGFSDPDQVVYRVGEGNDRKLFIKHVYAIKNLGPSVLPPTTVLFHLPTLTQEKELMVELLEPDFPNTECHIRYPQGPRVIESTTHRTTEMSTTPKWDINTIATAKPARRKRNAARRKRNADPENNLQEEPLVKNITCPEYNCEVKYVECHMKRLEAQEHVTVKLFFNIMEKNLPIDKKVNYLNYGTRGTVKQPTHPRLIPWPDPEVYHEVFTSLHPLIPPKEEIPLWIIIVSVIASLVILIIFMIILWKCGFFKREKRHDVKDWKQRSGYYDRRSRSNSTRSASSHKSKTGKTPDKA